MPDNESRAMQAARAVKAGTATQSEAARHHGISRQAVHRALERLAKREPTAAPDNDARAVIEQWRADHPDRATDNRDLEPLLDAVIDRSAVVG